MRNMENYAAKIEKIIVYLSMALLLLYLAASFAGRLRRLPVCTQETGWEVAGPDGRYEPKELPCRLKVGKGETVYARKILLQNGQEQEGFCFHSQQQLVKVYLGETLIYAHGETQNEILGNIVMGTWNFVQLPADSGGREIRIELTSPYAISSGDIDAVYRGNYLQMATYFVSEGVFMLCLSFAIAAVGFLSFFFLFVFEKRITRRALYEYVITVHLILALGVGYAVLLYLGGLRAMKFECGKIGRYVMLAAGIGMFVDMALYYRKNVRSFTPITRAACMLYVMIFVYDAARSMAENIQRRHEAEQELQERKTRLMLSQIQPHFIYNTLNTIRVLIRRSPDQAYDMVCYFSSYLRMNMQALGGREWITFDKEMEHVRMYAEIEKIRFGDRLNIEFDIQETGFYLPPLTVQPLVENAVKHGVCRRAAGGTVKVSSHRKQGGYEIVVQDDGVGFDTAKLEAAQDSIGIQNIRYRMEQIAGAKFEIRSMAGSGTTAVLFFPENARMEGKRE